MKGPGQLRDEPHEGKSRVRLGNNMFMLSIKIIILRICYVMTKEKNKLVVRVSLFSCARKKSKVLHLTRTIYNMRFYFYIRFTRFVYNYTYMLYIRVKPSSRK